MTAAFQSALAGLVTGEDVRHSMPGLADRDARRIDLLHGDPGVVVMRTLYMSWRLTKVLSLLPMTTRALGDEPAAIHLRRFWQESRARSLHFVDECLAFLGYLEAQAQGMTPIVIDAMALERARLELRAQASRGEAPVPRRVRLRHSSSALLGADGSAERSPALPAPVVLEVRLGTDGREDLAVLGFDEEQ